MKQIDLPREAPVTLAELRASGRSVITRTEAARVLEVDPRSVTKLIQAGEISARAIGTRVRIPLEPFVCWLEANARTEAGDA